MTHNETEKRREYHTPDAEIIKTFYPRDNNDSVLYFLLQEDPNMSLDLKSIVINFQLDIPKGVYPDNGLASKLFANLNIELSSQLITSTKSISELPLVDYLTTIGNFEEKYITSGLFGNGHFDPVSYTHLTLPTKA